jgi:hypothetical protein
MNITWSRIIACISCGKRRLGLRLVVVEHFGVKEAATEAGRSL